MRQDQGGSRRTQQSRYLGRACAGVPQSISGWLPPPERSEHLVDLGLRFHELEQTQATRSWVARPERQMDAVLSRGRKIRFDMPGMA